MAGYKQLGAYEAFVFTICDMEMSCGVFQVSGRFKQWSLVDIDIVFAQGHPFEAHKVDRVFLLQ
jgi:hypothetical protein